MDSIKETHEYWMKKALEAAKEAYILNEVPVGAVIVKDSKLISSGYNRREIDNSALAHAEILAIEEACKKLKSWRLEDCTLYVTLEPCPMCGGAIINSRIPKVVFGAFDPKSGCFGSLVNFNESAFNHKPDIISGVLIEDCSNILKRFFKQLRKPPVQD